jgi:hypothetical protein
VEVDTVYQIWFASMRKEVSYLGVDIQPRNWTSVYRLKELDSANSSIKLETNILHHFLCPSICPADTLILAFVTLRNQLSFARLMTNRNWEMMKLLFLGFRLFVK